MKTRIKAMSIAFGVIVVIIIQVVIVIVNKSSRNDNKDSFDQITKQDLEKIENSTVSIGILNPEGHEDAVQNELGNTNSNLEPRMTNETTSQEEEEDKMVENNEQETDIQEAQTIVGDIMEDLMNEEQIVLSKVMQNLMDKETNLSQDIKEPITTPNKRPNIIVMQPDDFPFFAEWTPPPKNPRYPVELEKSENMLGGGKRNEFAETFPNNYEMPYLERLRKNGLQMMLAYTSSSMCSTSRFSTITGRYPSRSGVNRQYNGDETQISEILVGNTKLQDIGHGKDCTQDNIATVLKSHGYRTGMVGKWHLSEFDPMTYKYEDSQKQIQGCGFDYVDGLYMENLNYYNESDKRFSHNNEWVTSKAVEFLRHERADDEPFFLYFNPTVPHPFGNVKDALKKYTCKDTPNGVLDEEPVVPKMTAEFSSCREYRKTIFERAGGSTADHDLGTIWVDDSVGALFHTLEEIGELDDTIFLFQIDHGVEAKSTHWENGNRIAQFIHYPKEFGTKGLKFTIPVSTIDIVPTLLDFAGVPNEDRYPVDGHSWRNYLNEKINGFVKDSKTSALVEDSIDSRCLMGELRKHRSLVCDKCHKLIYLNEDSFRQTEHLGYYAGFATGWNKMYFNLCTEDGTYVHYPQLSTETTNKAYEHWDVFRAMNSVLDCMLEKTSPMFEPDYTLSSCSFNAAMDLYRGITAPPALIPTPPPTSYPTRKPPPQLCSDFTSFFVNGVGERDCNWVALRSTNRCITYSEFCPVTCGLCSVNRNAKNWNNNN